MNNKKIMIAIGGVILVLFAVLFIYAIASIVGEESGPVNFGDGELSSESSEENSSDEESVPSGPVTGDSWNDLPDSNVSGDDGFEGSVIPGNNSSSSNSGSGSNSESSSSSSSSASSGSISGNGTGTGSNSGSSSSGSSSGPSLDDATSDGEVTYEEYIAMSGEEQQKYMNSFSSIEAFFEWYNAAKAKYDAEHPSIEIGDGEIDLGDIIGGNG